MRQGDNFIAGVISLENKKGKDTSLGSGFTLGTNKIFIYFFKKIKLNSRETIFFMPNELYFCISNPDNYTALPPNTAPSQRANLIILNAAVSV